MKNNFFPSFFLHFLKECNVRVIMLQELRYTLLNNVVVAIDAKKDRFFKVFRHVLIEMSRENCPVALDPQRNPYVLSA